MCSFLVKNAERHQEVKVEGGLYVSEALAEQVDILANPYNIECKVALRKHRKVKLSMAETHVFPPNEVLSTIIGLGTECDYTVGKYLAKVRMKVPMIHDMSNLYVYCDIVEHVVVGEVTAPLLCIVDIKPNAKRARMHTIMDTPILVPMQNKSFDTIIVYIMTNTGTHGPFADG